MKNIIIIHSYPLSIRTQDEFHIDDLIEAGFNIEYWDMSDYFFPGLSQHSFVLKTDYIHKVDNIDLLENKLRNTSIDDKVFIVTVSAYGKYCVLFNLFKIWKCFIVLIEYSTDAYSFFNNLYNIFFRFLKKKLNIKIKSIKYYLQTRMTKLLSQITHHSPYNTVMGINPKYNCTKVLINHHDYDRYKITFNLPCLINTKYAVFLDEYFPLHPDIKYFYNIYFNKEDSNNYLSLMCNFFNIIEQQTGVKIIIAAHPKCTYTESDFGNRSVLKGVTCQLIHHAKFVIAHASTSVIFAILHHRPLLFCYTNDFYKMKPLLSIIRSRSKFFKAPLVKIEQYINNKSLPEPHIDTAACEKYKYTFLTKPSIEEKSNKEIFVEYFKHL